MALRLVRETSATPNITNKDDTVMARYAYGGYNGVVKAFGSECEYTAESGVFKLLDGRIVIDGWEIDVDGAGWSLNLSNITGTQYHSVYAELNVLTETVAIKSSYLTGSYPEIDKGDDLTSAQNGTARLLLYHVRVVNGKIDEVVKKAEFIPYLVDQAKKLSSLEKDLTNGDVVVKIAQYASDDESKGTIEDRLTRLGFKEGRITEWSTVVSTEQGVNNIKRQGNYCILNWWIRPADIVTGDIWLNTQSVGIGTIPAEFSPLEEDKEVICFAQVDLDVGLSYCEVALKKNPDDGRFAVFLQKLRVYGNLQQKIQRVNLVNFGYEAKPL